MQRRDFLRLAALSPLALALPPQAWAEGAARRVRRLVLVELSGGNDGLNTVVPYADPQYAVLRPKLGVARDKVLMLDEQLGLHPALEPLMPAWKAGQLAVVQGLGYADSSRSHFRSIQVWDTASGADGVEVKGWITRIGTAESLGQGFAADAVVIGRNAGPVSGSRLAAMTMEDAKSFVAESRSPAIAAAASSNPTLQHVLRVQGELQHAARGLSEVRPPPPGEFPKTAFGKDVEQAARLIVNAPATPIVKIALVGFDTHGQQEATHRRLLTQLGESLAALRDSLIQADVWNDTLVMTYSEFGRRAKENGSGGTDHGVAAAHFVMGGSIKGGLYGERPNLARLEDGDLPVSTDYRCLYNSVLGGWWGLPAAQIDASRYRPLALV